MDVYQIALQTLNSKLLEARVTITDTERVRIQQQYNYQAVQKYIDNDIERARQSALLHERDRVTREREAYHKQNVIDIVSTIARRVIIEKRDNPYQILTESKTAEFRGFVKTAGARGCDVYPC